MIRTPLHLTSLPRTRWIMFGHGTAYPRPFSHLFFRASHPNVLLSGRSRQKYWGTLCVWLPANQCNTGVPHQLNNLQLAGSPKLYSWAFLPLDGRYSWRFDTPLRYSGHTITPFMWHLSMMFFKRPLVLQWVPPSFNRYATGVVLSICMIVYPLIDSSKFWQAISTVSSSRILMWVSALLCKPHASE